MTHEVKTGDCLSVLPTIEAGIAQTCVTSPPYFGLRDYGVAGQIGLEETPEEYVSNLVEVFREVRRVLRPDGTLWLNLGDSYASSPPGNKTVGVSAKSGLHGVNGESGKYRETLAAGHATKRDTSKLPGLKPKDLIGIPWAVAKAMRDPYYAGRVKAERDRAWLAATIDSEGTICGFDYQRGDDGSPRTGVNICITNSSTRMIDEALRIWPASRHEHNTHGEGHLGNLQTYRWIVNGTENKILFLREIYPHLVVKREQAILAYNLLLLMCDAKRLGHTPQRDAVREKRSLLVSLMSDANKARPCDVPSWCVEPPSVLEDGWYLRQEIIWAKGVSFDEDYNGTTMPESVKDRPTTSHEKIFLLSKRPRYFYDNEAAREPNASQKQREHNQRYAKVYANHTTGAAANGQPGNVNNVGIHSRPGRDGRNLRSVWTVNPAVFKEAHFATFPEQLIEPCILAGSREGDLVLDPFSGAGTTGVVALKHRRKYLGCELNPEYVEMSEHRLAVAEAMAKRATGQWAEIPRPNRRQIETPLFTENAL